MATFITIIKHPIGDLVDVISIIIVSGQGHNPPEIVCIDGGGLVEVPSEVSDVGVPLENLSEGVELVARGILGGLLDFSDELVVRQFEGRH